MKINIRAEEVKDYPAIAEINILAFTQAFSESNGVGNVGKAEMVLVDVLRHGPDFDPDLSLVAEVDGRVVGHALFYPYRILVMGQEMAAVGLHPIAVHPSFQKQGIGGALLVEAHRRAKEKGYVFSFLYGHPEYYPRFGYQQRMFGKCYLEIARQDIPEANGDIEERQLEPAHLEQVLAMWQTWFAEAPLAIIPGRSFLDWVTHFESFVTSVVLIGGEVRGFLRYHLTDPHKIKYFLAKDREATGRLLGYVGQKFADHNLPSLKIPLHPMAAAAQAWLPCPFAGKVETWEVGMIKIIDETNKTIRAYCDDVSAGKLSAGIVIYPPYVDGAE